MSENEVELENVEVNNATQQAEPEMHYVGVMFEDKYNSTLEKPKFYGKVYEYKTRRQLSKGEVIIIQSTYGPARVVVINDNIPKDKLSYWDVDSIKEI